MPYLGFTDVTTFSENSLTMMANDRDEHSSLNIRQKTGKEIIRHTKLSMKLTPNRYLFKSLILLIKWLIWAWAVVRYL